MNVEIYWKVFNDQPVFNDEHSYDTYVLIVVISRGRDKRLRNLGVKMIKLLFYERTGVG